MALEHYVVIDGNVIPLRNHNAFVATYMRTDNTPIPYKEVANAADDTRFAIIGLGDVLDDAYGEGAEEVPAPTVSQVAAANGVNVDALVRKYAAASERMYENRTAGDNSHLGLIASLLMELDGVIKS